MLNISLEHTFLVTKSGLLVVCRDEEAAIIESKDKKGFILLKTNSS